MGKIDDYSMKVRYYHSVSAMLVDRKNVPAQDSGEYDIVLEKSERGGWFLTWEKIRPEYEPQGH